MRLTLGNTSAGERLVCETSDGYRALGGPGLTLRDVISGGLPEPGPVVEVTAVRTPVTPGKIVAIGLNYLDHIREAGVEAPTRPLVFAKFPSSVVSEGDEIVFDPAVAERVDWEVELAVVVGRTARCVSVEDALSHVFAYTVANDVSARDVQFADGQWIRGKNLDSFCPLAAVVVTADEVPDPQTLGLGTQVNGEVKQSSNTGLMLFSVAEIIAYCSASFTLEPGDVILTGTPWGCGEFMTPQESLRDGDHVRVWVDGIASLTNTVRTGNGG